MKKSSEKPRVKKRLSYQEIGARIALEKAHHKSCGEGFEAERNVARSELRGEDLHKSNRFPMAPHPPEEVFVDPKKKARWYEYWNEVNSWWSDVIKEENRRVRNKEDGPGLGEPND